MGSDPTRDEVGSFRWRYGVQYNAMIRARVCVCVCVCVCVVYVDVDGKRMLGGDSTCTEYTDNIACWLPTRGTQSTLE